MNRIDTTDMSHNQILDLADWHDERARDARKEKNAKSAERHEDIVDRLCVRARRVE